MKSRDCPWITDFDKFLGKNTAKILTGSCPLHTKGPLCMGTG